MAQKPIRVKVTGLDKAVRRINQQLSKITGATTEGLLEAGLLVQRRAQQKVPVEYGNLRASAYTRRALGGDKVTATVRETGEVEVGFGAAYALYVHENMEQKLKGEPRPSGLGVYWGPHGEPKFLEKALQESADDIVRIVERKARNP